jgi:hypothetical protein
MAFADGRIDQPARDPIWARRNIEAPLHALRRLVDEGSTGSARTAPLGEAEVG